MAVVHHTTLEPGKLELLTAWLPTREWFTGTTPHLHKAGGFRLDDPDGEVGIEHLLVVDTADARQPVYHVPMTYRGAPLPGADVALIGTSEHGVLGTRWIYDAARDPVALAQMAALLSGARADGGAAQRPRGGPGPEPQRHSRPHRRGVRRRSGNAEGRARQSDSVTVGRIRARVGPSGLDRCGGRHGRGGRAGGSGELNAHACGRKESR
ncbi:maltokinase N-terminal cap-like domain-containing protein [Nocardia aobensis]|uniref:maltokinase N-terminal cap-like domain-containing protein n=1 Tax=Nocardia aobensis TaxID=257277 RepID=UPI0002FBC2AD|nr:hypothetical protein [Nocardia aobensis]